VFFVIEGIDGAGTTTQSELLEKALSEHGHTPHRTREPSDGPIGKLLRAILRGEHAPTSATTLGLLFAADRSDHIQREIAPALEAGRVVISDRYYHSSLAYQGSDEDRSWIEVLNERAMVPDCTFFLEVDPTVAARRRHEEARDEELFDAIETQKRVAEGYRAVMRAKESTERIERIDGHLRVDAIAEKILRIALPLLSETTTP